MVLIGLVVITAFLLLSILFHEMGHWVVAKSCLEDETIRMHKTYHWWGLCINQHIKGKIDYDRHPHFPTLLAISGFFFQLPIVFMGLVLWGAMMGASGTPLIVLSLYAAIAICLLGSSSDIRHIIQNRGKPEEEGS